MHKFQFKAHYIITILYSIFFMASCMNNPPVPAAVADNFCVDDLYTNNYCKQDIVPQGVYKTVFLRSWVYNAEQDTYAYSLLPRYSYGHFVNFDGYVVFTPNRKKPWEGTLYGVLVGITNGKAYRLPWYLSSGHYEILPSSSGYHLRFQSHEYGDPELYVKVYKNNKGFELWFMYKDGTPFFDLRVMYNGLFNACPSPTTLYSGEETGQCFKNERCKNLTSDCITRDDCIWLLEREGHTVGSWAPQGKWCEHVEIPERPLYQ